jgi:tetratricopeptide (TPR) repeat protein
MEKINSLPGKNINIEDALSEAAKLRGDGDYPGAEKLFSSVVALRERTLGLGNETTQASLNQLAFVLLRQEKFAEAEKIYTELLKLREAKYGNGDRGSTGYRFNLLSIYKAQVKFPGISLLLFT